MHTRLSTAAAALALLTLAAALPAGQVLAAEQSTGATTEADKKAASDKKKSDKKASSDAMNKASKALKSGDVDEQGTYKLGSDEMAMDCKRMTGAMKITINRLKDAASRQGVSGTAEAAHKTMPYIFGGSTVGSDREASLRRERAKLNAYNRELAARSCKTLDIEAELARPADTFKKY
jgi:hypothetical protein